MMSAQLLSPEWIVAGLVWLGLLGVSLWAYGALALRVRRKEGQVADRSFALADLLVVIVLSFWLGLAAFSGLMAAGGEGREVIGSDLVEGALFFGVLVTAIGGFLQWRKIPPVELFGLTRLPFFQAVGKGLGYLLLAYPTILLSSFVMIRILGEEARPQEVLEFFRHALAESNLRDLLLATFTSVIVAPICEEFLFRGYIYGTLRRFLGPGLAIGLSSLLFAAIHVNLLALPILFLLAICLALAYEATGSIVVPIVMHLGFNSITLISTLYLYQAAPVP
ncbi:MAG TPA: type II CAAX endopeptidase family protein [Chthoniobacteraceae bacterium]|nr:type II CAAX endopeptidase family protein [Chthoniobacteraceae bacterium]